MNTILDWTLRASLLIALGIGSFYMLSTTSSPHAPKQAEQSELRHLPPERTTVELMGVGSSPAAARSNAYSRALFLARKGRLGNGEETLQVVEDLARGCTRNSETGMFEVYVRSYYS